MIYVTKWILLFVCGFDCIHGQNTTLYFNSSSESITIGSQFYITCSVESTERFDDRVEIRRNGALICRYDIFLPYRCSDNYGYHFSRDRDKYDCDCVYVNRQNIILNITIKVTSKEDNGTWVCDADSVSEILSVQVKYPPSINSIRIEPKKDEIKEGTDVKLSCLVDSFPKSNITWTFNEVEKNNGGLDFVITNAKCEDSGKYTCWAENGIRSKAWKTEQINVYCSPRINLKEKPMTLISASSTESVTLTATVMAYPVPNFTWRYLLEDKSEKPITDWRVKMESNNLTSYLNIVNITEQDFGNYIMYAKNTEGEISVVFTLKDVGDVSRYGTVDSDNKLGRGIGIGFIIGLLVMGVIVAIIFFIWKKRGGKGINLRQLKLQYKKKSTTKGAFTTETAQSTGQTSSPAPNTTVQSTGQTSSPGPNTTAQSTGQTSSPGPNTTIESDQMYEGLDMNNSPQPTYEQINIYENQGVVA